VYSFRQIALVALLACAAPGQQPPSRIADVLSLPEAQARSMAVVTVRGVVTHLAAARAHFFLHDGSGGIIAGLKDAGLCPDFAQEVEVTGTTGQSTGANFITATSVRVIGPGTLPAPKRLPVPEAGGPGLFAEWVETEGVVAQARYRTNGEGMEIQIIGDHGWTWVALGSAPAGTQRETWWGARVRVRGLNAGGGIQCMRPDERGTFEILAPGRGDVFAAPARDAATLRGVAAAATADRMRMKGTVTYQRDGWIYLRDGETAFRADRMVNYAPAEGWRPAPGTVVMPEFNTGAILDLVGSPMVTHPALSLRYAQIRFRANGEVPAPRPAKLAEVVSGAVANDLVTVRGRLVEYTSGSFAVASSQGVLREVLRLSGEGSFVEVLLESAGDAGAFAAFNRGEIIEATGIVRPDVGERAFRLLLRSRGDARSLGPDPDVARGLVLKVIVIAAVALFAALAWVGFTRRTVAARTAQLAVANEQLDAALAAEREVGDLKTRFVSLVSHEFRTPLGITMSAVELLRHYADRLPGGKRAELLDDIHEATLRMSGMMEQMLVLGRVESGRMQCKAVPFDLPEFAAKLVDESLSSTAKKCPIELVMEGGLAGASGDESLLRHIVSNLLSNAAKYSDPGSPVTLRVSRDGDDAVFAVSDRGIGIPEADQERLFEAFHRASNVGETPGTGLGLMIVKRCVELHGGTIRFKSEPGKGTSFTARMPLFAK
jgi:signal transduction histidine kinase